MTVLRTTAIPEWFFNAVMENAHGTFGGLAPKIVNALYAAMLRADEHKCALDIVKQVQAQLYEEDRDERRGLEEMEADSDYARREEIARQIEELQLLMDKAEDIESRTSIGMRIQALHDQEDNPTGLGK